jgi:23S rRNA pseudouridine1911/1915/1917 synthase
MPTESGAVPLEILCDDGPVLAVNKPAGLLTLGAKPGVATLEREVKAYLKERFQKPGNVYLGIPHRIDRPVSGVVVFARNSKAAARLAEQFRERQVKKIYWALVEHTPETPEGELIDWLLKSPDEARVEIVPAGTPGAREARLRYRVVQAQSVIPSPSMEEGQAGGDSLNQPTALIQNGGALLEIEPLTGRTHQIRVQLASRGWPIVGDFQYGATQPLGLVRQPDPRDEPIGLHARSLTILHPIRYDSLTITAPLPAEWGSIVVPIE